MSLPRQGFYKSIAPRFGSGSGNTKPRTAKEAKKIYGGHCEACCLCGPLLAGNSIPSLDAEDPALQVFRAPKLRQGPLGG
jgi:hypothetical protein